MAYVTTGRGATVVAVDTHEGRGRRTIPVGERPWGIGITPDGRTLFVANGPSDDVSIVDTATRKETGRVKVGKRPWGVVVVP